MSVEAGDTIGGYRLTRKLGQGGMGAVYEAVSPAGERVAIKVMSRTDQDPLAVRRFLREARAMRTIASRHVVRVLDAAGEGSDQGSPFLVMERLEGTDLNTLVRQVGALEPVATARVFVQAARGLAAAHAKGIIHRDIKPSNLFLHEERGLIVTKLCDFGVAKSLATADDPTASIELTHTGGLLGSPVYMSPEQASNARDVDARSDLWSLSMSLYEALCGQRPWGHCSTVGQLIVAICTEEVAPLGSLAPWVGPELAALVHRGLQRDPGRRWGSSDDLADALERLARPGEVTRADLDSLPASQRRLPVARGADQPRASLGGSSDPLTLSASRGSPPAVEPAPRTPSLAATRAESPVDSALVVRPAAPVVASEPAGGTPRGLAAGGSGRRVWPVALGLGVVLVGLASRANRAPETRSAAEAPAASERVTPPDASARAGASAPTAPPASAAPVSAAAVASAPTSASAATAASAATTRASVAPAVGRPPGRPVAPSATRVEPEAPKAPVAPAEPKMHGDL